MNRCSYAYCPPLYDFYCPIDIQAESPSEQEQLFYGIVALRATVLVWVGFL